MVGDESDLDALAAFLAAKRAAREAQRAGAGGRRKKRVKRRMEQAVVDAILRNNPFDEPLLVFSEESLARMPGAFRSPYASSKAIFERMRAFNADVRKQCEEKGYAEMEVEVAGDDHEEENSKVVVITDDVAAKVGN